jgi:hypothetical protein
MKSIAPPKLGGGRALINSPVGYFSEGARLQGGREGGGRWSVLLMYNNINQ